MMPVFMSTATCRQNELDYSSVIVITCGTCTESPRDNVLRPSSGGERAFSKNLPSACVRREAHVEEDAAGDHVQRVSLVLGTAVRAVAAASFVRLLARASRHCCAHAGIMAILAGTRAFTGDHMGVGAASPPSPPLANVNVILRNGMLDHSWEVT